MPCHGTVVISGIITLLISRQTFKDDLKTVSFPD